MYKIGDFSKIVDIPVRTLRFYAEYGVLIPSETDKYTGYKYYSDDNILECELIKILKSLDFTLDEIKIYRNNIDEEVLEKKKNEIQEKINILGTKYDTLSYIQNNIRNHKGIFINGKEKILRRYEDENDRQVA